MKLETSVHGNITVIKILGEVDHYSGPALAEAVEETLRAGGKRIAFDFSDCLYMDSGGFGVLLELLQRVGPDGLLAIIAANRHLQRMFEMVGLASSVNVRLVSSVQELGALS